MKETLIYVLCQLSVYLSWGILDRMLGWKKPVDGWCLGIVDCLTKKILIHVSADLYPCLLSTLDDVFISCFSVL